MDPILIVVILAAVVGAAAFLFLRGRNDAGRLPPGDAKRSLPEPTRAPPEPGRDAGKRREPAKETPEASPRDVAAAEPARAPEDAAGPDEEEELERVTPPPDAPLSGRPPSREDIEALKEGLKTTRGGFITRLAKLFGKKPEIDPALLDEIEEVLIGADIGVKTTQQILAALRERLERKELADPDRIWDAIRDEALGILRKATGPIRLSHRPTVILVVGVNGVGKTTTIGKLASRLKDEGKSVVLAAGDTFRAAAVLQLEVWGRRVGCPVVKGKERADPGSVVFEAIKKAQSDGADVVIADTAGRLHTKLPLMEELKKVVRTAEKALEGGRRTRCCSSSTRRTARTRSSRPRCSRKRFR